MMMLFFCFIVDVSLFNVVDGNNDINVLNGYCSLMDEIGNYGIVWWRICLLFVFYIKFINIVFRNFCEFLCEDWVIF